MVSRCTNLTLQALKRGHRFERGIKKTKEVLKMGGDNSDLNISYICIKLSNNT